MAGINTNYRDQFTTSNMYNNDGTNQTDKTDTQVWNAVFTDKSENTLDMDGFLKLMVAQLTNQDFMNPVDDTQFVTQMAQFSMMQQMQQMGEYTKTNYTMSLVGKNVTAARLSVSGDLQKETGVIEKLSLVGNEYKIYVNGKQFSLDQIMEIHADGAASSGNNSTDSKNTSEYLQSLLDKHVTVIERDDEGEESARIEGVVERITEEGGHKQVYVAGVWYPLEDVVEVGSAAPLPAYDDEPFYTAPDYTGSEGYDESLAGLLYW